MKNFTFLLSVLFAGLYFTASSKPGVPQAYGEAFIFVENGVEFAIYPNGEFDFYFNPDFRRSNIVNISSPRVNISYNAGYSYEPYVQFDDYGAVVQIENVPVFYDYYGRIAQAGNVLINYNYYGQLASVGNLFVHYDRFNRISYYSGYINSYNRRYIPRPWHSYYTRPNTALAVVYNTPYRAYYQPTRVTYNQYINYYSNNPNPRQKFYRPNDNNVAYTRGRRTSEERIVRSSSGTSRRSEIPRSSDQYRTTRVPSSAISRSTRGSNTQGSISNNNSRIEPNRGRSSSEKIERSSSTRSTENNRPTRSRVYTNQNNTRSSSRSERARQPNVSENRNSVRSSNSRSTARASSRDSDRSARKSSNNSGSARSSARNMRSNN